VNTWRRQILILLQRTGRSLMLLAAIVATSPAIAAPGDLLFKITPPDPQPGAGFGELLAVVDGDILVAEPNRTLGLGINAVGRAYLFDGKSGALKRTFDNAAPMNLDDFARAITGGDGRVFISTSGTESRVFAFDIATGALLHTLRSPDDSDGFGAAMDYDAGKLLVSDPSFSISAQLRTVGRAYLFDAANAPWTIPRSSPATP
jgi:outer membrane protein assembly factor BamB